MKSARNSRKPAPAAGIRWGTLVCSLALLALSAPLSADTPRLIHYQGKLVTSAGAIVSGPVNLRLRLYGDPTNSTPLLFDESHAGVSLSNGLFSILLGSQTGGGVPDSAFAGTGVYLGVSVNGATELSPRTRIATAPFASKARSAEQLVKPGSVSPEVTVDAMGHVGVGGGAHPSAKLDVASTNAGFLPPRLTQAQRDAIASPAVGLMIFNTTTNCINVWMGTSWRQTCLECTFTPPVAGNNGPLCEGSTLNLSASTIAGAVYAWTGPNGFSSALQNPSIPTATTAATGPYSVTATLDGCTSNPVSTLVTVNAVPTSPAISSNSPICTGQTLTLTSNSIPGAIYTWTGPNSFSSNLQNPSVPNATAAASGTYTLIITVNGCQSLPSSTSVTVGATPAMPGAINGETTVCANTSGHLYSIGDVEGATSYTWTVPPGATIAAGQGSAFITVSFGSSSGNMTVTASNFCGTSAARTLAVSVQGGSSSVTLSATASGRNGTLQNFTVPTCVTSINIEAWGAQGGDGNAGAGGLGARMKGTFAVTPGQVLKVLVGQQGIRGGCEGGGGGGTFVTDASNSPLIVAGGGGGTSQNTAGSGGSTGNNGLVGDQGGAGGTGGGGGGTAGGGRGSAGGGGLTGNGADSGWSNGGIKGGLSFTNGGTGGDGSGGGTNPPPHGGYGGGGGAHGSCYIGGGGGGGYSGGGGGIDNGSGRGGGGGGSFNNGTNQDNSSAIRSGHGQVVISW